MKESTDEFDKLSTKIGELEKDKLLAEKRVQGEVERANVAETEKENIERSLTKLKNEYDEYKRVAGQEEKRLRRDIEVYERQKDDEDRLTKQMKNELEIHKGQVQNKQEKIDEITKENERLKREIDEKISNIGKLDNDATQKFEKNPLDDKIKELEAGVKVLQDRIMSKDKEISRLKEDLENSVKATEAAVARAVANATIGGLSIGSGEPVQMNAAPAGRGMANPPGRGEATAPGGRTMANPPGRGEATAPQGRAMANPPGRGEATAPGGRAMANPPGRGEATAPGGRAMANPPGRGEA